MKSTIVTLALMLGFSLASMAQDVPSAAKDAFKKQYPNAESVDWEKKDKDGKTLYIAEYKIGKTEHHAVYDANGKLVKHKTEIAHSSLPGAIQTSLKNQYKDYKVDDAYKVVKDGKTFYMVKLDGKEDKKVAFNADGTVIKEHTDWD